MCIICLEFQKNTMTIMEARTALKELIMFTDSGEARQHAEELARMSDAEFEAKTKEVSAEDSK